MRGGTEPIWRARSTLWTASNSAATPPGLVRTYGRLGGVELYPQAGTRCVVRATGKLHFELADTSDSTNVVKDDSRPRAPTSRPTHAKHATHQRHSHRPRAERRPRRWGAMSPARRGL